MVIWRGSRCTAKLFWVWGAYGLAMMVLWQAFRGAGLPDVVSWAVAGVLGLGLLA